jgi:Ni/Co efflux regulator RcnB
MKTLLTFVAMLSFVCIAVAQPADQSAGDRGPMMQQMQERMEAMHARMARIHDTEDPAERQRLMREHRDSMRENMRMMGRMMSEESGQARGPMSECPAGDAECRMQRMEARQSMMAQRMQMMQQMMEHMLEEVPNDAIAGESPAEAEDHEAHH